MLLFAVVALLALIGVTVSALGGLRDDGGRALQLVLVPRLAPAVTDAAVLLLITLVALVGGLAFAYLRERMQRAAQQQDELQRSRIPRAVVLFITAPLVVALLSIVLLSVISGQGQSGQGFSAQLSQRLQQIDEQAERGELVSAEELERSRLRGRRLPIAILAVAIGLFALIAVFGGRLLREAPPAIDSGMLITEQLRRELATAAGLALDDIAAEPDHRRAVERCYARMESVLERHGFPRPLHQTPLEYMHTVLDAGPGLPATMLLDLTGLYEVAKFSAHSIDREARARAIDLLRGVHQFLVTRLEAAASPPGGHGSVA